MQTFVESSEYGTKKFFKKQIKPSISTEKKECTEFLDFFLNEVDQTIESIEKNEDLKPNLILLTKHLYMFSFISRDVVYRITFNSFLPKFLNLIFKVSDLIEKDEENEIENVQVEIIRCFYRLIQNYSEELQKIENVTNTIISYVLKQMNGYKKEKHTIILISMDFFRIICQLDTLNLDHCADQILKILSSFLVLQINWDSIEFIEIIELFAQILKKYLNLNSYHSMKINTSNQSIKLKFDIKLFSNVYEKIYHLDIIKSSTLFATSYLTIILQNDVKDIVKKSTNHILDRIKLMIKNEQSDQNTKELMFKILRQFISNVKFTKDELKIIFKFLKENSDYLNDNELVRPYTKLLNSFIKTCGADIDEFSSNQKLNFVEDNFPLESIKGAMYKLYSEYIHSIKSNKSKLKPVLKIVPFLLNRLPHEVHRKDIEDSLKCIESIASYIKEEEFNEFYEKTLNVYSSLLKNSLISIGVFVLNSLQKILLLKIQIKKFSIIEDLLFNILKQNYKEDKKPIQIEEEDDVDVESEFSLSILNIFNEFLNDKDLIEVVSIDKLLKYCFNELSKEVLYETDEIERIEQSSLILKILKSKKSIKGIEYYSTLESYTRAIENLNDLGSQLILIKNMNEMFNGMDLTTLINFIKSSSKNQLVYFQELNDVLNHSIEDILNSEMDEEDFEFEEYEEEEEEEEEKEIYDELKKEFEKHSKILQGNISNLKKLI
eukprot:gene1865-1006_t